MVKELSIIQKAYDLVMWSVPLVNKLPRDHKFGLGDRVVLGLYSLLEELIHAKYARRDKRERLEGLNARLDVLRLRWIQPHRRLVARHVFSFLPPQKAQGSQDEFLDFE